ncbi:uncharacterized protein LOC125040534 [Penaeus chinensis]|uniref:uncharacterized protein LOC125040534 n=1 Tax=Penaeus chinensis TaxID=139456 RepID=UPI001FB7FD9A|nr:uncharacterized protein LOC125040534 [Penaeus chinensis]XP_047491067.1 uncharacterized protein LOC125040534 [Penaeus chinensis]
MSKGIPRWLLVCAACAWVLAGRTEARSITCRQNVDCKKICDENGSFYLPQDCTSCCPRGGKEAMAVKENTVEGRLTAMEAAVNDLRVMTGVLLALVLLLILVVLTILLHLTKNIPKLTLPVFFKNAKKGAANLNDKSSTHKTCNGVADTNVAVGRIANHQTSSSPKTKKSSFRKSTYGPTEDTVGQYEPRSFRVRQPSESTCPDEGADISQQGYDNLGLSTSTIHTSNLHNTSNSSTDTLGPIVSTNTLDTTLASENNIPSVVNNTTV